jgi:hypothetical protein
MAKKRKKSVKKGKRIAKKSEAIGKKAQRISVKAWQEDIIVIILLILAVFILFHPFILQNKVFSRGDDTASSLACKRFIDNHKDELGRVPYWCPYVFCGFPAYSAGGYMGYHHAPNYNVTKWINPMFYVTTVANTLFFNKPNVSWLIALLFLAGVFTYLLLRGFGISGWIAGILALIMAWNPYFISLVTASHGGKLRTLIFLPLILLFTHRVMERRRLIDVALLGMAVGWLISIGAHAQVVYYGAIIVVLYFLYRTVVEWNDGLVKVAANAGSLSMAGVIGVMIGSLWTVPLYSYIPYSIRGMGPAFAEAGAGGLTLEYATSWSFHPLELGTFAVPSLFGLQSPYYWGWMPFTSSSFYIGIVPLVFAVMALIYARNRTVWFCLILSIIVFLMSLGRHLMPLYELLFTILPGFNKFRTPSLILLVMQVAMIVMAAYGIQALLTGKMGGASRQSDLAKRFLILAGVFGGLFVLVLALKSVLFSGLSSFMFIKAGDATRYNVQTLQQLQLLRYNMFHRDLLIALALTGVVFLLISLRLRGWLATSGFLVFLAVVVVVDMAIISRRFFDPKPRSTLEEPFVETGDIAFVKQDQSLFRVLPLGEKFQDNVWMAHGIQSVGGYQGAKVRRYQDILDYALYQGQDPQFPLNHNLVDLVGAKYLVAKGTLPGDRYEAVHYDKPTGMVVSRNPNVMPRAFFVDTVWVRNGRRDVLEKLVDPEWDPRKVAIVEQDVGWEPGQGERSVEIDSYGVEEVLLKAAVSRPSLMVLADTHHPGNWHCEVDGQPTPIYFANYLLRAIVVPEGEHTIRFYYRSRAIEAGVTLSTIGYIVGAVFLVAGMVWEWRRRKVLAD